jgi:c-di-GMP-binding flagellar brake protein YcgR
VTSSQGSAKKPTGRDWRRRYSRYRIDLPIKATVLGEAGYEEIRGRCCDMGEGGLGAVLTSEISQGEVVALELQLPETPPLEVRGIIRYRKGLLHGVEFLGLSAESRGMVLRLCEGAALLD